MKMKIALGLLLLFVAMPGFALKNVCGHCNSTVELEAIICSNCGEYPNKCSECGFPNPVKNDDCALCCFPLAESRVISTIPMEVRNTYKIGQSPRAMLDKENAQITCWLERIPEREANLLFELSLNLRRMKFYAREAEAWKSFLHKYPDRPEAIQVRGYYSEALCHWAYLFYRQNEPWQAEARLIEALTVNPNNREAHRLLRQVKTLATITVTERGGIPDDGLEEAARWFPRSSVSDLK